LPPLCPVDFLVLQMSEEEILKLEDTLLLYNSDSEMFQTAEGVSSADEADGTGLSEEEGEGPAGAEAPGQREERPAGAKTPGSQQEIQPPGHTARRKNKCKSRYGAGRRERRRRKVLQKLEATRLAGDQGPGSPVPQTSGPPREPGGDPESHAI